MTLEIQNSVTTSMWEVLEGSCQTQKLLLKYHNTETPQGSLNKNEMYKQFKASEYYILILVYFPFQDNDDIVIQLTGNQYIFLKKDSLIKQYNTTEMNSITKKVICKGS